MISRWPDSDRTRIGSYVASLDLRNLKSRTCYQQVLHSFQDIVERHGLLDQRLAGRPQMAMRRQSLSLQNMQLTRFRLL
ncbi:hypothetical protein [Sinorhizobium mexicanum]|uniref:Uncharacterized protein n=1 Tax=Sinorhizobium mexicanum TaxID=375549 RepID=A0A859QVD2_9HYPH|nr:hypothetical protein [Sinorhizobium mexicanum]MBP1888357.1 hypothetical protein [Sinorhizobium mexicanum]QLL64436.1 hypothetical protein FKV68_23740 [Sinorhizobium mexicanum]